MVRDFYSWITSVATEHLTFAMPETGIGFYPDIGASYFLSRLPHKMGFYLGLTGVRIAYNDCLAVGLVDAIISRASQDKLISALADSPLKNKSTISEIIGQFSIESPKSDLFEHHVEIENCFSKHSVEDIIAALENYPHDLSKQQHYQNKIPNKFKITLRTYEAEKLRPGRCMQMGTV